jgi:hypothetical protein
MRISKSKCKCPGAMTRFDTDATVELSRMTT